MGLGSINTELEYAVCTSVHHETHRGYCSWHIAIFVLLIPNMSKESECECVSV